MKLNSLLKNISNHLGNYSKKVLLSVILVLLCFWVWGGNYRLRSSVTNGNWSDTIWQYSSLGITWSDDNRIPGNGDIVYIQNGSGGTITIDLTSDITVNELHIDSDNKGGTVIINTNGYTLTANNLYIGKKDSTTTEGDI